MSRFDFYSPRDSQDATSGDAVFTGINMTLDKSLLSPGMLSIGQNTRLRNGSVKQRAGTEMAPDFNPVGGFDPIAGYTTQIVGSGIFRNPLGDEVMVVAPSGQDYTWVLQDGKDSKQIDYSGAVNPPTGNNGTGGVQFCQAFDKLLLLRAPLQGSPTENLVWNGEYDAADSDRWQKVVLSTNGFKLAPAAWNGEPFMDRVVLYFAKFGAPSFRDTWYLTDINDYTSYDDIFQKFQTNSGESDKITRIMSYFRRSLVIFKNQSIHMATVLPAFPVQIEQRILSSQLGSIGNKMPLMIGGDVIFLSQTNGFYRLSEVLQESVQTLPVPISERIQGVIDRISWGPTASFGCSAALGNYAFFGVAINKGRLNTILVYDTARNEWESAGDTWADYRFTFDALHVTNFNGVSRLFAIDYLNGIVYLLYEGVHDHIKNGQFSVPFKMETRGYIGDDPLQFKRFGRATVSISTSDPEITVTALTDGFNEEKNLTPTPISKRTTKYYTHGTPDFNPLTDSATAPYREDYSVENIEIVAIEDFENLPVGPITRIPGASRSIASQDQQESLERFLVRSFGRWCALRIENNEGTCEVLATGVESTRTMNTGKLAA